MFDNVKYKGTRVARKPHGGIEKYKCVVTFQIEEKQSSSPVKAGKNGLC